MKYFSVLFSLCMLLSCTQEKSVYISTSFHEPAISGLRYIYSTDGLHWDSIPGTWLTPKLGNQQVMRDPSIVRSPQGIYHLVWTTSWKGDKGFGYAQSEDLIHWSEPKMIEVMQHEPSTVNVWAPELFYDDEKDQYMIVWASCIPNRYDLGEEEVNNNHRLFYTTTKDFNTFTETKLLFDPGFNSIDATIVKRDKNDYVMVFKDNTRKNRNLRVAFASSPEGPYYDVSEALTDSFTEGPTVLHIGDTYYIYFDAYRKYCYDGISTQDFKNFYSLEEQVSFPKGHKHGTAFQVPESTFNNLIKKASEKQ